MQAIELVVVDFSVRSDAWAASVCAPCVVLVQHRFEDAARFARRVLQRMRQLTASRSGVRRVRYVGEESTDVRTQCARLRIFGAVKAVSPAVELVLEVPSARAEAQREAAPPRARELLH